MEIFRSMESQGGMDRLGFRPKVDADEGSRTLDSLGSIWSFDGDSNSGEVTTKGIKLHGWVRRLGDLYV